MFGLHGSHILQPVFPDGSTTRTRIILRLTSLTYTAPLHHTGNADCFNTLRGLGSSRFARRYYGNRYYFLFLQVLRWFNSLSSLFQSYGFTPEAIPSTGIGFSHSEISGSKLACSSPKLIAAGHVFHWSLAPRHPPCALYNLFLLALDH